MICAGLFLLVCFFIFLCQPITAIWPILVTFSSGVFALISLRNYHPSNIHVRLLCQFFVPYEKRFRLCECRLRGQDGNNDKERDDNFRNCVQRYGPLYTQRYTHERSQSFCHSSSSFFGGGNRHGPELTFDHASWSSCLLVTITKPWSDFNTSFTVQRWGTSVKRALLSTHISEDHRG